MNILITGGNGQLGRDCRVVLQKDHRVIAVDIEDLDITDPAGVDAFVKKIRPDVIVNCAAFTQVDDCEIKQKAARRVNVEGPGNLSASARRYGAQLIHISTDYVFDGQKPPPGPYMETDAPGPLSCYGRTKLAGEQAVLRHAGGFIILRTAWLYGFYGKNFLKTILCRALAGNPSSLKIVDDQYGSPTWSYRLARQIRHLIQHRAKGIYHASSEGYCTWYALAKLFLKKMEIPCDITPCRTEDYPTPAVRPKNSILENSRLTAEGLNRMKPWQDDLDQFVRRYKDRLIQECQTQAETVKRRL
jgi:dTDP-4-dehydrorhamnose reductase